MRNFILGFLFAASVIGAATVFATHLPMKVHGAIIIEDASGDCWEWKPDDTTGAVVTSSISCP